MKKQKRRCTIFYHCGNYPEMCHECRREGVKQDYYIPRRPVDELPLQQLGDAV